MSELYFIRHTAPTLAGLKTGSLFPCHPAPGETLRTTLRSFRRRIRPYGLQLVPLRTKCGSTLLYVYRPDMLAEDLSSPMAERIMRRAGYSGCDRSICLAGLCRRLRSEGEFPHEIGLFLGYPPEDVRGFIRYRGRNCRLIGPWKVYGSVEQAQTRFEAFKSCTARLCERWENGTPLESLISG